MKKLLLLWLRTEKAFSLRHTRKIKEKESEEGEEARAQLVSEKVRVRECVGSRADLFPMRGANTNDAKLSQPNAFGLLTLCFFFVDCPSLLARPVDPNPPNCTSAQSNKGMPTPRRLLFGFSFLCPLHRSFPIHPPSVPPSLPFLSISFFDLPIKAQLLGNSSIIIQQQRDFHHRLSLNSPPTRCGFGQPIFLLRSTSVAPVLRRYRTRPTPSLPDNLFSFISCRSVCQARSDMKVSHASTLC